MSDASMITQMEALAQALRDALEEIRLLKERVADLERKEQADNVILLE